MSPPSTPQSVASCRWAIAVRGVVQGVGFRPFVYNAANSLGLSGWVQNTAEQVRIEAQGERSVLEAFCQTLRHKHPRPARIDLLEIAEIAPQAATDGFVIRSSEGEAAPRPTIPADLAVCAECWEEIRTPGERRYRYPFTNCTNCGPRWSIVQQLPYDRPRTSMARFAMCPACEAEYRNPADRRFHAQPIACPTCGPSLDLWDRQGAVQAAGDAALRQAAEAVRNGRVLALKGLGGFQLIVDATSANAVTLLRERKRRPDKPFALMLASVEEIRRHCELSAEELAALESPAAPIVLLRRRPDRQRPDELVEELAPGNPYLGVMLPYTPLHHVLLEAIGRPIVCTSGNIAEEPMAIDNDDALRRLGAIADRFLVHDRPIVRPVDDSVGRATSAGFQLHRRARGYAPLPIDLGLDGPPLLATGGHLKNTVGVALGSQAVLSSHIGDLEHVLSVEVHGQAIADLVEFFQLRPAAVVCDLHPDYASTRSAEHWASQWQVPVIRVQHHHAHVAACMAEYHLQGPVLGLAWDGTGYGPDGTIWGGEVLECQGPHFRRVAHLRTFALPGGDRAIREPRRSALGALVEIEGPEARGYVESWFDVSELKTLLQMITRGVHAPRTSSMGRLFDAVAALCGLPRVISFEGQAAMALEFAADREETGSYPLPLVGQSPAVADWEPLLRAVLAERREGVPVAKISARFHNALADFALAVAHRWGGRQVVLSGGCFHNELLAERVQQRLSAAGFAVYLPRLVPPGDGGITLGQLAVARQWER